MIQHRVMLLVTTFEVVLCHRYSSIDVWVPDEGVTLLLRPESDEILVK